MFDKKAYMKEYNQRTKARKAEYMRVWRAEHPDRVKEINHQQYLRRKAAKNGSGGVSGGGGDGGV